MKCYIIWICSNTQCIFLSTGPFVDKSINCILWFVWHFRDGVISGPWHRFFEFLKYVMMTRTRIFPTWKIIVSFTYILRLIRVCVCVFVLRSYFEMASYCFLVFMLEIRLQILLRAHFHIYSSLFAILAKAYSNDDCLSHNIGLSARVGGSEKWDNDIVASLLNRFSIKIHWHAYQWRFKLKIVSYHIAWVKPRQLLSEFRFFFFFRVKLFFFAVRYLLFWCRSILCDQKNKIKFIEHHIT